MEAFLKDLVAQAQLQLQNPLAVPILGSLAALLFSIVALYSLASAGKKQKQKKVPAGGTIITDGVRRSTRAHKPPPRAFTPEKEVPKTPKTTKTPKSTKKVEAEAMTVTPKAAKPRARAAAKTPATEPAATRTRRGAAKTPK